MADVVYSASLTVKQILDALNQVDKTNQKVWQRAEKDANRAIKGIIADHKRLSALTSKLDKDLAGNAKGFKSIGDSAQASGIQIGAVAGIVSSLTTSFINLGQQAVGALVNMTKESVTLASNLETTQAIFTGVLGGNEDAAVAALQHIREESRGLGIDLAETSRAFLPFVASLEELDRVNRIGAALAISQPEQGELGARIALQESLSGNVSSLVRRFEIPKNLGKELQRALDEGGVEAFLTTFEGIMKKLGRDVDQLTDTFQFSLGRFTEGGKQLQTAFGVPITDELKSQLDELNKIVEENFADFEGLATLAGEAVAEFVGAFDASAVAEFFADNKQDIAEFLTAIREIAKSAKELADIDLSQGINVDSLTNAALKVNQIVDALNALKTISQESGGVGGGIAGALTGGLEAVFPIYSTFINIWENLDTVIQGVIQTYGVFLATASQGAAVLSNTLQNIINVSTGNIGSLEGIVDPQKAYNDAIESTNKALADYKKNTADSAAAVNNAVIPVRENTEANEGLTDSILALNKAQSDLANLEEDAAGAQAKVNEAMADAKKDFDQKLEDIDIAAERKRLDIQIEFAQKREDAARDNLQKLADIQTKNQQDITDAATDLERKEEDIARKFANERIDLEKDDREKRLDIETSYRQKLEDIQKQSSFDLEEAERNRDAVSFLRILRQQQQQVSVAQTDRQREIDELRVQGERKKEELRTQQTRELEEARIANEQKLADLQLNLERQIEAQNTAFERQIVDIATAEQRKNEEATRARERDIEDAKLAFDRKLADLAVSLASELALIEEFGAQKLALLEEIAAAEAEIAAANRSRGGRAAGFGPNPGTITGHAQPDEPTRPTANRPFPVRPGAGRPRRQFGGPVGAGQSFLVGERGPELFTPKMNGIVIPSERLMMNTGGAGANGVNNFNNQRTVSVNQSMLDPSRQSAIMRAIARQEALDLINGLD